ncbi:hypothetical protein TrLO_g14757 [Triparma laevis f. longispina]|uniref:Uncharacterized protein n=1 Tax=Triparma laevis f. longispina TaxID=1714387 RepID=A0A9W7FGR1_9STRA|nr:hypothetical protein TrLO_g14757 [Triparma laevis f. longispina]
MSYTKPESSGRRVAWQLQAIEANRQGDSEKMKEAFDFSRKGSNINQKIVSGAYGGYKFPTWGNLYGGNVSGQTMLHLAVRPDNECYSNRYLIAKTLVQNLKIDTSIRDEHELPARKMSDKAQQLVDAVHPLKRWTEDDCVAWLEGLGEWTKKNKQWSQHFLDSSVTGNLLVTFLEEEHTKAFTHWLEKTHSDLAHREVYNSERGYVRQGLKQLLKEFKQANAYRRQQEKPFILEARRVKRIEHREERKEMALMAYEESQQREDEETEERAENDEEEEQKWVSLEGEVNGQIRAKQAEEAELQGRVDSLEQRSADPSIDSSDSKGKKRSKSMIAKQEASDAAAKQDLQANLSGLKAELDGCQKEIKVLQDSLEVGQMKQDDRDMFQEWLKVNDELRELDLDFLYDTVDIEDMEEVISAYPNICKDEEQRMEKLSLVEERNELRKVLDEKYWNFSVEDKRLYLCSIRVTLCENELPRLNERGVNISEEMEELGEGEDAELRFAELDSLQGYVSRRRYHRGEVLLPALIEARDAVRRRIEMKKQAERAEAEREEQEERRRVGREEELKRVKEMGEAGKGGEDNEEEEGGFRVQVGSSSEGSEDDDSDDSGLSDDDEDEDGDQGSHDDSDDAFGSDEDN